MAAKTRAGLVAQREEHEALGRVALREGAQGRGDAPARAAPARHEREHDGTISAAPPTRSAGAATAVETQASQKNAKKARRTSESLPRSLGIGAPAFRRLVLLGYLGRVNRRAALLSLALIACQPAAERARSAPLEAPLELVALGLEAPAGPDALPTHAVAFRSPDGALRPVDRRAARFVPRWRDGAALVDPEGRLYQVWPDG